MATAANIATDAATIAKALKGKKAGSGWSCKCPAHDDAHASLSLTQKDGKVLWYCHAGCPQEVVTDALQPLALLEARSRREPRRRAASPRAAPKVPSKPTPLNALDGGKSDAAY